MPPLDRLSVRCLSSYLIFRIQFLVTGQLRGQRSQVCAPSFFLSRESGNPEELLRLNRRRLVAACAPGGIFVAVAVLMALAATVLVLGSRRTSGRDVASNVSTDSARPPERSVRLPPLPLIFEPNQGQTDPQVKFLARGSGYALFLTADQAVLTLRHSLPTRQSSVVVSMTLEGASENSPVSGADQLPGKSNYFLGNDPAKWHTDVPQFARVRYRAVYPGIDLVYYGKQGQLEYDFEAAPGSDPQQVTLRFQGAENLDHRFRRRSGARGRRWPRHPASAHESINVSENKSARSTAASNCAARIASALPWVPTTNAAPSSSIQSSPIPPISAAAVTKPAPSFWT